MSDQQFSELLNQLNVEDLKDVIHKLPYEKVTAVIGQLDNKDQSHDIIEMMKEKFGEQSEKWQEFLNKLDQMLPSESEKIFGNTSHVPSQNSNAEFMEAMTYVQYEPEYL